MSKLSLSVDPRHGKPASKDLVTLDNLDATLATTTSVPALRAVEELAEAAKRYAKTHEQRVAATVAKLKIARRGGQLLREMGRRGERALSGGSLRKESRPATLSDLSLSKSRSSRWQAVGNLKDDAFGELVAAVVQADPDSDLGVIVMGGLKGSTSNEWYTPARYIDAAREVMGGIDLDPASSPLANETVGAAAIFTAEDDGLRRDWHGRVWLNPPYGKGSGEFTTKLVGEYEAGRATAAVLLLNAYGFDSDWFDPLWDHPICFTDHRITFTSPQRPSGGPANGNIFVYLGPEPSKFRDVFSEFGHVVKTWDEAA